MRSARRAPAGQLLPRPPASVNLRIGRIGLPQTVAALLASVLLIAPTVSSYTSAALYILLIAALASFALNPGKYALQPAEKLIALFFAAYFLIGALRGLAAQNPAGALSQIAPNLVFLFAAPLLSMLRCETKQANWDQMLSMLAAGGAVIGLYSLFNSFYVGGEFDPPTGNPLILALFCGLAGLLLLERAFVWPGGFPWLHVAGFAGATTALWLTARRSAILAYLVCAIILVLWNARRIYWLRLAAALAIVTAAATAAPTGHAAVDRFSSTKNLGAAPAQGGSRSDSIRIAMYIGGARAFFERPFVGHGRQNAVSAANGLRNAEAPAFEKFNHLHSAPLTEAVSAGLLGISAFFALLATPLIALRRERGSLFRTALVCLCFFALCSVLNVGFYVDATSSGFVFAVCMLNALAAARPGPPSAPAAS
jgi:O-Antigen ligase